MNELGQRLLQLYTSLQAHFAHEPHWWPIVSATPQFEVLVGAVLVQQTRWEAVEAAVQRLQHAGLLTPATLAAADTTQLAALLRPCAFHGQKATGLQAIARYLLNTYAGDTAALLRHERAVLRAELLALPRIGRETADTIMLYAGGHPLFVVDTFTRRLFARVGLLPGVDVLRVRYDWLQAEIEAALAAEDQGPGIGDQGQVVNRPTASAAGGEMIASYRPPSSVPGPPSPVLHPPSSTLRPPSFVQGFDLPAAISPTQAAACTFYRSLHALIVEACIHHCLASRPRCERVGLRRTFVDPRKCAEHCHECGGCPLRAVCGYNH